MTEPTDISLPLPQVGSYRITEWLGDGAVASVYRAVHLQIGREVAIKIMERRYEKSEPHTLRFINEARAANRISHPHVVEIYDIGHDHGEGHYFVMEHLEGPNLSEILAREGPLHARRAVRLARQLASALNASHAAGVIHRDVKPSNIIVVRDPEGEEHVKLIDFGVSKLITDREHSPAVDLTSEDEVVGTVGYMSLEQVCGETATVQLDVYAFGVVLFEMLTGRRPFEEQDLFPLMMRIARESPPTASSLEPSVPAELDLLIERCLDRRPERRPASMEEVERRLEEWQMKGPPGRSWAWKVCLCIATVGVVVGLSQIDAGGPSLPPRNPPPTPVIEALPPPPPPLPPPPPPVVEEERVEKKPVEAKERHRRRRKRPPALTREPARISFPDRSFLLDPFAEE